mmetsp:Transcript_51164/g.91952  ORF Transcript_51164/g.91952 Transcript_51164/m.91952 type:complete len:250 (-) Transcript_51164:124-873(-)
MAPMTTKPSRSLCREDTPTAKPSGKLCAVSATIMRKAKRICLLFESEDVSTVPSSESAESSSFLLGATSGSGTNFLKMRKLSRPAAVNSTACSRVSASSMAAPKSSTQETVSMTPAAKASANAICAGVGKPCNSKTIPAPSEVDNPATRDRKMAVNLASRSNLAFLSVSSWLVAWPLSSSCRVSDATSEREPSLLNRESVASGWPCGLETCTAGPLLGRVLRIATRSKTGLLSIAPADLELQEQPSRPG